MTKYMEQAILLAQKAGAAGEVPVGAVIVKDGKVIAVGEKPARKDEKRSGTCRDRGNRQSVQGARHMAA